MWRSTELNFGDLVLWDFNIVHRAGYNNSTDFRTALYASFARSSRIQDQNFQINDEKEERFIDKFIVDSMRSGKFGEPALKETTSAKDNCYENGGSFCQSPWSSEDSLRGLLPHTKYAANKC
jgi:hypothetical protein